MPTYTDLLNQMVNEYDSADDSTWYPDTELAGGAYDYDFNDRYAYRPSSLAAGACDTCPKNRCKTKGRYSKNVLEQMKRAARALRKRNAETPMRPNEWLYHDDYIQRKC